MSLPRSSKVCTDPEQVSHHPGWINGEALPMNCLTSTHVYALHTGEWQGEGPLSNVFEVLSYCHTIVQQYDNTSSMTGLHKSCRTLDLLNYQIL